MQLLIKGQGALEYLMIVALTLAIIVPTTFLFFSYSSDSNLQIIDSQIQQAGRTIIDTAETVFYSGEDSKLIIEVTMPERVNEVYIIENRELVFNISTATLGDSEVVFFSAINISSPLCTGPICALNISLVGQKKIAFRSILNGKQVLISKV